VRCFLFWLGDVSASDLIGFEWFREFDKANLVCDAVCVQRYLQLHEEVELSALGMGKFLAR
jgi:hypothetical protein